MNFLISEASAERDLLHSTSLSLALDRPRLYLLLRRQRNQKINFAQRTCYDSRLLMYPIRTDQESVSWSWQPMRELRLKPTSVFTSAILISLPWLALRIWECAPAIALRGCSLVPFSGLSAQSDVSTHSGISLALNINQLDSCILFMTHLDQWICEILVWIKIEWIRTIGWCIKWSRRNIQRPWYKRTRYEILSR